MKIIELNEQQIELLKTLLEPLAQDNGNSNFVRLVAAQLIDKLEK